MTEASHTSKDRLTGHNLVEMYQLMLLGRRFTEQALSWYAEGRVPQGLHPSAGQEAVGVGVCYGLQAGDWALPSLRTSEAFWTRGVKIRQQLHAMCGTVRSISGGKETSHHSGYPDLGILAGTGVVCGSIPVATGVAMGLAMQGTDHVVVCFFGDGAANRGDFHEALNLAAVINAPAIFVCENNLYAQTVPASAAMAIHDIADRAAAYGMPGQIVDGQDVEAVYHATQTAISRARRGEGPTLLECKTYRFLPHYPVFDENRPKEERDHWLERDPIRILGDRLSQSGLLNDAAIDQMEQTIRQELDSAIAEVETAAMPDPGQVFTNIYADGADQETR
jgi:TPP-dependent pyruvate/acetoin dehydrogenase alpha subunit